MTILLLIAIIGILMVLGAIAVWASPQVEWYYILIYIGVFGIFFNLSYHR